jgi:histidine phosphotransferase ChpT
MRPDIAALVGSRICHDLISPLGAIGNGVELMSLTDGNTDQEMALITESVENANARIRFFRISYGAASTDQMISRTEVMSVLSATARGGRFTYFWQVEDDQPRRDVRIAFLLLQCLETAFPAGGDISVTQKGGNWEVSGTATRINFDETLWDTLHSTRPKFDHTAAQVQFALLPMVISEARRKLEITATPTHVTATF